MSGECSSEARGCCLGVANVFLNYSLGSNFENLDKSNAENQIVRDKRNPLNIRKIGSNPYNNKKRDYSKSRLTPQKDLSFDLLSDKKNKQRTKSAINSDNKQHKPHGSHTKNDKFKNNINNKLTPVGDRQAKHNERNKNDHKASKSPYNRHRNYMKTPEKFIHMHDRKKSS